ncbi:Stp1/IreP family PP2C-type Ser/Thr phosphatase [Staphylococcus hyicus]|uniref:Stp1/IreP family PP2C-type Ser/Thr phosphatase n=1 Tax=Staphylococcus hyicus TaxID=1284 RepID=A0ACD5FLT3_STAHY|nr:Stp1/IreP family PP2C-type Ser/Thr phosphatase [Staphylococcus hyicus]MCO4328229.1 Stp1/IreP family PP2C-type Ser/Thr phosphatase [Staphylococcus hyicus]MCO4330812.1 Stp1/IreP family PP2C-type Ser/Thr phosphatase [Staphylococcus hyicus]MCO4334316.1 Stp1/IreP family PP2C-type Ser/Thr phosphatase [Staphylococcus hyicus]MCO4335914.1 Stp1/IreP family PP2C-type Ser/Thr phosphatase [Staphylococcus hyicus]MDP4461143.1 Stp1/IreP family PP2C-type Ser/Thr phosphatase [Staphylococcus hyicus]
MLNAELFSDAGFYREQNEDAGGIFYNQTDQQLLVICDGMGGHQAGEVAAQYVVETLQKRFEEENYIEQENAELWLKQTLQSINLELFLLAESEQAYHGMGTTCVCALIFDHHIVVANIGDSRAYLVNGRYFDQVTIDHTFVNQLVMLGQITQEEALHHPRRNIITKVMGTDRRVNPDVFTKRIHFYQYLLLNSDGLTDYVPLQAIHDVLNQQTTLAEAGEALIALAKSYEAKDNTSFVLAEIAGDPV